MFNETMHVLIIEDNAGDARLIQEMLAGGRIFRSVLVHAATLSEGLECLGKNKFDIILLDIGLPDSDGLNSIHKIKELARKTPIVILTGLNDRPTSVEALKLGVQDYLEKGEIDSESLSRSLRYAVERKNVEETLINAKDELENRVRERTEELINTNALLKLFTRASFRHEYLALVVKLVHEWTGCGYVGVRVINRYGGIPFESCLGFGGDFLEEENRLSVKIDRCVCIRIISGERERCEESYISPEGSFYCNNFIKFMESLGENEKRYFKTACINNGFSSLAIVPIRYQKDVLGLLHIADRKEGKLQEKQIKFIEKVMPIVGEALHRFIVEEDHNRLMVASEASPDAIVITDSLGKIEYTNPAFERMTGYTREEVAGHDLHILDSDKHTDEFYSGIRNRTMQGKGWSGRMISKKKNGTLYHEECTISPVRDMTGRTINYASIRSDITDRLRLESIAEAVNTMENIGYVFTGIRHEIGNPVTALKMTLNLLLRNFDKYSRDAVLGYLERCLEEISKVEYLLQNLKTFNMYEEPEIKLVVLKDFLGKFLSLLNTNYKNKRINIKSSIEPGVEFCFTDPRALQQVLMNIFTNAVDSCEMKDNPEISITLTRSSGTVRLRMSDNGCGMTKEQMENLFKPFHTTKIRGTGLGLVIAKKLLAKMDAHIEITSRLNEGTDVDILLPEDGVDN